MNNLYYAETHEVTNRVAPLQDHNSYLIDLPLQQAIKAHGAAWSEAELTQLGQVVGSAEVIEWGVLANKHKPSLMTHDSNGYRVDEVVFHPAYHQLMQLSLQHGVHSSHWTDVKIGAHVARAAKSYLITQVEAGHGCPITMTSAAIPALKLQPDIYQQWADKIMACNYDQRNVPYMDKSALTIGMAMTEKQGGSDVRTNTTRAYPVEEQGPGQLYRLVGHKYFVSAPMCDGFLVLAKTERGVSCFLLPRWCPDGSKNPLQIQQLKDKMGNVSNASSETELRGALAWMIGEDGRGVSVILQMVAMTRFDCMIGSSAGMRQAVLQATHHCQHRVAFGKPLIEQPLMQNVLADLALESEAALVMTMRVAAALDRAETDPVQADLVRLTTAIGKYWICKRTPAHAYEAMECIGGSGVMENSIMPRLFRESPVNSIWEGSGNVQCLDVLRAVTTKADTFEALMAELEQAKGQQAAYDEYIQQLRPSLALAVEHAYHARTLVEQLALAFQACCLLRHGDPIVAEAFCLSRLQGQGWVYGTLPATIDYQYLINRTIAGTGN